jgi:Tfp pilus assembly protein PilF
MRINKIILLLLVIFCHSAVKAADDPGNDYFAPRTDNLVNLVEQYHIRTESFWKAYRSGNVRQALPEVEFVLRYFPNHPQGMMLVGSIARLLKNHSLAILHYERALRFYPQHAITHAQYGAYLAEIDRIEDGLAKLKQAIEMNPNLVSAHVWLARAYSKKGEHELANRALEQARALGYTGAAP